MIIKSLSRKKQPGRSIRASVMDLYSYIVKGADNSVPFICHNLNMKNDGVKEQDVINQFESLISNLPSHKSRNLFYHEILSFKRSEYVLLSEQLDILRLTTTLYLQERARDNLAFAAVHTDHQGEHVHYHILLSANTYLEPEKRFALSRKEFSAIQKKIEFTIQSLFPQLKLETVYNQYKDGYDKNKDLYKVKNKEYELKKRIGNKKTYREQVKDLLLQGFDLSYDSKSFIEFLNKFKIRFYQRNKHVGIIFDGKKYRLNRLGLENRHELFYQQIIKFEQNMKSIDIFGVRNDSIENIDQKGIDSIENSNLSMKEKQNLKDILNFIKENNTHSKDDFEFEM